jgi:hypothetical protein
VSVIEGTAVNNVVRLYYLDAHADGSRRAADRHRARSLGAGRGVHRADEAPLAAAHTRLPEKWTRGFLAGRWRGTPVPERVPAAVVEAIQRESAQVSPTSASLGWILLAPDEGAFVDVLEGLLRDIPLAGSRPG